MKHHHIGGIVAAIFILIIGIFVFSVGSVSSPDELTGSWRAGGTNAAGLDWYMEYEFGAGRYELETGTDYEEKGSYSINERYEDGSIIVHKVFYDGEKTYDMMVLTVDDPNIIFIEGVQLNRVE
ncbi:hypothetical protein HOI18_03200 [Candidatus Uhrbacteria bacterium]|nr:hypothetical protein [Candidatus Uhrbacteria bacterium]